MTTTEKLCPGIQKAVEFLNMEGFLTTDSGDGSHWHEGMDCAMKDPMVAIDVAKEQLIIESERLHDILRAENIRATVEASYSPLDGHAVIVAYGPEMVKLGK